jgi:hypothetical protein
VSSHLREIGEKCRQIDKLASWEVVAANGLKYEILMRRTAVEQVVGETSRVVVIAYEHCAHIWSQFFLHANNVKEALQFMSPQENQYKCLHMYAHKRS